MIMNMYTILDTVAKESGDIQFAKNDEVALRFFNSAISKSPTPNEYALYCVGSYNTETMVVVPCEPTLVPYKLDKSEVK